MNYIFFLVKFVGCMTVILLVAATVTAAYYNESYINALSDAVFFCLAPITMLALIVASKYLKVPRTYLASVAVFFGIISLWLLAAILSVN